MAGRTGGRDFSRGAMTGLHAGEDLPQISLQRWGLPKRRLMSQRYGLELLIDCGLIQKGGYRPLLECNRSDIGYDCFFD